MMFAKSTVAVVVFLASFVAAQTIANSTIDPNTVDLTTKSIWCAAEISTCGTLCSGNFDANTCDPPSLNFTCTCTANGSAPGLQFYTESIPTFICEQVFSNCIKAGEMDSAAQAICKKNEAANCGKLSPENFTAPAATTSSSSTTASATAASTPATASTSSTSTSKAAAATMMAMGREYGAGVVAAGVAAAFGFML